MAKKNPLYRQWENTLDEGARKEYYDLIDRIKNFRKKHKARVFLVNRELKKKGSRKRHNPSEKRERVKKR